MVLRPLYTLQLRSSLLDIDLPKVVFPAADGPDQMTAAVANAAGQLRLEEARVAESRRTLISSRS